MGYPWGKAPTKVGEQPAPETVDVLQGTSPVDMQRIIGAQYMSSGILPNGGLSVEGTSSMAYKVNPGACFMWTSSSARTGMLVPVEATTVNTVAAPSTGSRVDTVYVDGEGAVRVVQGTSIPGGVAIARFTVPAGITATTAAQQSLDRHFAIPTGASLGLLHRFHDPANGIAGNTAPMTLGSGRFTLPSDRMVRFDLTHCIGGESGEATVMRWRVYIDGILETAFTTRAEWTLPQVNHFSFSKSLSEGAHQVHYVQDRYYGARFIHHKGGADAWPGNRFEVWDAGASQ